jgi:hypothetical protein
MILFVLAICSLPTHDPETTITNQLCLVDRENHDRQAMFVPKLDTKAMDHPRELIHWYSYYLYAQVLTIDNDEGYEE